VEKKVPKTIENQRVYDETMTYDDEEVSWQDSISVIIAVVFFFKV